MLYLKIFSPILSIVFPFCLCFLCFAKAYIRSYLFIFVFVFIALGSSLKKILLWFTSKSILPVLTSKRFIFDITLRSLIHFEFILCIFLGSVLISFFCMELSSFPSTLSIIYSCLLFHRLVGHRWLDLSIQRYKGSIKVHYCYCTTFSFSLNVCQFYT